VRTCADRAPDRDCVAVLRPRTPGYPVVTAELSRAVADVLSGTDPRTALRTAARAIDADRAANDGCR
jgi:multiple sugar transport system substrate-binding protein